MFKNGLLSNPTLAIKTSSSAVVKTTNAFQYNLGGVFYNKTAGDCPALSGTVADDYKRVWFLYINAAGTLSWDVSDSVALAADVDLVTLRNNELAIGDDAQVLVGAVVVINETGSDFTGGTTALDTANLTVYYINTYGLVSQDMWI